MHCTSTQRTSTAPVTRMASVDMKLPAWGTPWRTSISAPEQHMPTRLMPLAPAALAFSMSILSWEETSMDSKRLGSWPWMMTFTWSSLSTPMLTSTATGVGVPKRMSEISVATMEPPQPSAKAVRLICLVRFS